MSALRGSPEMGSTVRMWTSASLQISAAALAANVPTATEASSAPVPLEGFTSPGKMSALVRDHSFSPSLCFLLFGSLSAFFLLLFPLTFLQCGQCLALSFFPLCFPLFAISLFSFAFSLSHSLFSVFLSRLFPFLFPLSVKLGFLFFCTFMLCFLNRLAVPCGF